MPRLRRDAPPNGSSGSSCRWEGSIAGWVFKTGQPAVVDNVRQDERHYSQVDSSDL